MRARTCTYKAESASGPHCCQHTRPSERQDGSPEQASGDGPSHTDLTVGKWEDLRGVREWHRSLAWAVKRRKQEDEKGNQAEMRFARFRNVETESSSEEAPRHLREGEQEESTAPERVNGPHCRESEDEVDQTEAEGRQQRSKVGGAACNKD